MQTKRKYDISKEELKAVIMLYQLKNPYMTTKRIYARWKTGKLNLLIDYKVWSKKDFEDLMKGKNG